MIFLALLFGLIVCGMPIWPAKASVYRVVGAAIEPPGPRGHAGGRLLCIDPAAPLRRKASRTAPLTTDIRKSLAGLPKPLFHRTRHADGRL